MTGREFLEKVRGIKEITAIHWNVKGDCYNPDLNHVVVIADGKEIKLTYPDFSIKTPDDVVFMPFACIALIINRAMELIGNDKRFYWSNCFSGAPINYAIRQFDIIDYFKSYPEDIGCVTFE